MDFIILFIFNYINSGGCCICFHHPLIVKEIIKNEPELAAELEQKIKDKIAEDIEKAKEERVAKANAAKPAPKPEKKITREEALAKINIMVEDDED